MMHPQTLASAPAWFQLRASAARSQATSSHKLLAQFLLDTIPAEPRRLLIMKRAGQQKYVEVAKPKTWSYQRAIEHVSGAESYGASLCKTIDGKEYARAGALDYDQDGDAIERRLHQAARELGLLILTVRVNSGSHNGLHAWAFFDDWYSAADVHQRMQELTRAANAPTDEIWPVTGQGIRLLFGYHQRAKTRGCVTLSTGEQFNLDVDLDAAIIAVLSMPQNGKPPTIKESVNASAQVQNPPQHTTRLATEAQKAAVQPLNQRIDTKAIAAQVRARFNAENSWEELLGLYGGTLTRSGWKCNCGYSHSGFVQIAVTSQDKIISYSPNCRWAPHRDSGKALDKFGFYIDQAHGGNYRAALEIKACEYGLWVEISKASSRDQANLEQPIDISPAQLAQRQAYNAQRKARRHAETREALEALYDRVGTLSFTSVVPTDCNAEKHGDRAIALFLYLYDLAITAGCLQVAPTNEQLANALGYCKRNIVYAFRELEASGIGKRQGGKSGIGNQPNEAATWTFFHKPTVSEMHLCAVEAAPDLDCKPHQDAECTLSNIELDLDIESNDLVKGGVSPLLTFAPEIQCETHQVVLAAAPASPALASLTADKIIVDTSGAWYDPASAKPLSGKYKGNLKRFASFEDCEESSNAAIKLRSDYVADETGQEDQASLREAEIPFSTTSKKQGHRNAKKRNREISAIDRYRVDVAIMNPKALAGEKRKLENTIRKRKGATWFRHSEIPKRLAIVAQELAERGRRSKVEYAPASPGPQGGRYVSLFDGIGV